MCLQQVWRSLSGNCVSLYPGSTRRSAVRGYTVYLHARLQNDNKNMALLFKGPTHGSQQGSTPTNRRFDFTARHTVKAGLLLQISAHRGHNSAGASRAEFYLHSQGQRRGGQDKGLQKRHLNAALSACPKEVVSSAHTTATRSRERQGGGERKGEEGRDRQTDRQRHTHRETERQRQTHTHTDRDRHIHTHTHTHTHRGRDRVKQRDRPTETGRQTGIQTDGETGRQRDNSNSNILFHKDCSLSREADGESK